MIAATLIPLITKANKRDVVRFLIQKKFHQSRLISMCNAATSKPSIEERYISIGT